MTAEPIPRSIEEEWANDERAMWLLDRVQHVCDQLGVLVRFPVIQNWGTQHVTLQLLRDVLDLIEGAEYDAKADCEVLDRTQNVMNVARVIVSLLCLLGSRGGDSDEIGSVIYDLLYVRTTTKQPYRVGRHAPL